MKKQLHIPKLREKWSEATAAVLPVIGIVLLLGFTIAPIPAGILLCFLAGALLVMLGIMFFSLGAELSMSPMGEMVGAKMTRTKNVRLIVCLAFLLGFMITVSEPDLQVLAQQVPSVPNLTLVLSVAVGVGLFLVLAMLRILLRIHLAWLLIGLYALTFGLTRFVPGNFIAVAFDSGGVTTGPMTVPFIMALGVGVAAIRNDRNAADDSFGLVALCSVGPILAVLILGMLYHPDQSSTGTLPVPQPESSLALFRLFAAELPHFMSEIAVSLLPIVLFFAAFQLLSLRLQGRKLRKILAGLVYTYIGLTLFLTGANAGFMPAGNYLGGVIAAAEHRFLLVPIGAIIGFFIVRAEPAVYVLNHQVEEITDGAISAQAMGIALSLGVATSVALAMTRVLTGIPILYFLLPGYALALGLSFFVPKIFTAIAFDSGGVASGPMTATFLLPLAQGACVAAGGNPAEDAFGVVAMVAMTPLITIQVLGVVSRLRQPRPGPTEFALAGLDDDAIIEL